VPLPVRVQSDIRQHADRRVRATEARFGADCLHFSVRNMPGGAVKEAPYCFLRGRYPIKTYADQVL
jgi:hypothetical protein